MDITDGMISVALALGAYVAWKRSAFFARARLLGQPAVPIRTAPDGNVLIEGKVARLGPLLEAPISGISCVLFDVTIEEWIALRHERLIMSAKQGVAFGVDDGTEIAEVVVGDSDPESSRCWAPQAVDVSVEEDRRRDLGALDRSRVRRIGALLARYGIEPPRGLVGNLAVLAREGTIVPGDLVTIVGRGSRENRVSGEAGDHRLPPTRYVIRPAEDFRLKIIKTAR